MMAIHGTKDRIIFKVCSGDDQKICRSRKILRNENIEADALAKFGSQRDAQMLGAIPLEIQERASIFEVEIMQIEEEVVTTWMTPIWDYIKEGKFPEDKFEAKKLKYKAARYVEYDGNLYRRGFNQPLLKCIDGDECRYITREVHEWICKNHSGGRSLAGKILRQGYY